MSILTHFTQKSFYHIFFDIAIVKHKKDTKKTQKKKQKRQRNNNKKATP
jgi:hypothetical protein